MENKRIRMRSKETQESINQNKNTEKEHGAFYNAITDRMRDFRISKGLTQEELADKIDVSTSVMRSIERFASAFRVHHIKKIVEAFPDLTYNYIIDGKEEKRNLTPITPHKEVVQQADKYKKLYDNSIERIKTQDDLIKLLQKEIEILKGQ